MSSEAETPESNITVLVTGAGRTGGMAAIKLHGRSTGVQTLYTRYRSAG